ncbi:UDP-3-O-(3-hydroxymyristoyl)glucosamine N-acyltransferase [Ramlibacter sp.]|uniref:UDP-3-O-(3-hydroxymyristoyl)glucosamine N-acyltransferase n=1 Tax=Ramlibacter sp. TaxID=1917967 RepID=UPI003D14EC08
MVLTLGSIVAELGGELRGDLSSAVQRLAPLESAGPDELSFLSNPKFRHQLATTRAGCIVVGPALAGEAGARGACIVVDDPYLYFARLTQLWKRSHAREDGPRIHPSAVVHPEAFVDATARIGPLCVIERGARIGPDTELKARVTVSEDCVVGARCVVQSGAVIGGDGFGFAPHDGAWVRIEQLGAVRIGDDVDIGANTCIDRGALADTIVEDGVKLDNLIQVGHNCRIGRHTAIAGCVGIAGSANIGAHCTIGGAAMILGHLTLADRVNISAGSFVARSILKPGHYTGIFPIDDNASWEKNAATLRQLYTLRERIKALEKR